jgi:hypothetical protein
MEFRLTYQGLLAANGNPAQKHAIRSALHPQLRELWTAIPLNLFHAYLNPPPIAPVPAAAGGAAAAPAFTNIRQVGGFNFAQLVHSDLRLHAELDILMLRPGDIGGLLIQGGDIDNRLKTLFDALRAPHQPNELPAGAVPAADEDPFHCLLQDDQLVTKVSVTTDRWLNPTAGPNDVSLVISVKIKGRLATHGNLCLIV